MKVGDIIRRTTVFGGLIGPYKEVTRVSKNMLYARVIGTLEEELCIQQFYKVVQVHRLSVSREQLENISSGKVNVISHEATSKWDELIDKVEENKADVIMFYNKSKKVYYTILGVKRTLRFIWNGSRTAGKKKPCITIFLDQNIEIYGH